MAIAETEQERDEECKKAFQNLMTTIRSLGASLEQCDSIIEEISLYGHHKQWAGWHKGWATGYLSGKARERSYHV